MDFYKILIEHGIAVTIVFFTGWMVFRYLNIRLEMMKKEFDKKLAERVYKVEGTITKRVSTSSDKMEINFRISEEIEKSQQN